MGRRTRRSMRRVRRNTSVSMIMHRRLPVLLRTTAGDRRHRSTRVRLGRPLLVANDLDSRTGAGHHTRPVRLRLAARSGAPSSRVCAVRQRRRRRRGLCRSRVLRDRCGPRGAVNQHGRLSMLLRICGALGRTVSLSGSHCTGRTGGSVLRSHCGIPIRLRRHLKRRRRGAVAMRRERGRHALQRSGRPVGCCRGPWWLRLSVKACRKSSVIFLMTIVRNGLARSLLEDVVLRGCPVGLRRAIAVLRRCGASTRGQSEALRRRRHRADGVRGSRTLRRGSRRTQRSLLLSRWTHCMGPAVRRMLLGSQSRRWRRRSRHTRGLGIRASASGLVEHRRTRVDLVRLRVGNVTLDVLAVRRRRRGRHKVILPVAFGLVQVGHRRAPLSRWKRPNLKLAIRLGMPVRRSSRVTVRRPVRVLTDVSVRFVDSLGYSVGATVHITSVTVGLSGSILIGRARRCRLRHSVRKPSLLGRLVHWVPWGWHVQRASFTTTYEV